MEAPDPSQAAPPHAASSSPSSGVQWLIDASNQAAASAAAASPKAAPKASPKAKGIDPIELYSSTCGCIALHRPGMMRYVGWVSKAKAKAKGHGSPEQRRAITVAARLAPRLLHTTALGTETVFVIYSVPFASV